MNKTITPNLNFQPYVNESGMEELQYLDRSFRVELWSANFDNVAHNQLPTHWHQAFEFALITSGKALYRFGPEWVTLAAGDALFVNSSVPHSTSPFDRNLEMFTIAFPPIVFGLPGFSLYEEAIVPVLHGNIGGAVLKDPLIIQLLQEIYADSRKPELSFLRLSGQVLQLWKSLLDFLQREESEQYTFPKQGQREETYLKECISFIRTNWRDRFSIDDMAASASISKNTCYRLFKKYLHVTPTTYINHFRISQAELLLLETELPVAEIALACGFNSVVYFDRIFRRRHGKTPLQYRHTER